MFWDTLFNVYCWFISIKPKVNNTITHVWRKIFWVTCFLCKEHHKAFEFRTLGSTSTWCLEAIKIVSSPTQSINMWEHGSQQTAERIFVYKTWNRKVKFTVWPSLGIYVWSNNSFATLCVPSRDQGLVTLELQINFSV